MPDQRPAGIVMDPFVVDPFGNTMEESQSALFAAYSMPHLVSVDQTESMERWALSIRGGEDVITEGRVKYSIYPAHLCLLVHSQQICSDILDAYLKLVEAVGNEIRWKHIRSTNLPTLRPSNKTDFVISMPTSFFRNNWPIPTDIGLTRHQLSNVDFADFRKIEIVLVPIILDHQWRLLVIYPRRRTMRLLDSSDNRRNNTAHAVKNLHQVIRNNDRTLSSTAKKCLHSVIRFLRLKYRDDFDTTQWMLDATRSCIQSKREDSGVFAIINAELTVRALHPDLADVFANDDHRPTTVTENHRSLTSLRLGIAKTIDRGVI